MVLFHKTNKRDIFRYKDNVYCENQGIGNLLILLIILQEIEKGNLLLEDTVIVDQGIDKESSDRKSIGFTEGEEISLVNLIELQVLLSPPDVSLLLARLYRNKLKKSAQKEIEKFITQNELTLNSALNISGRSIRNKEQQFSLKDLLIISSCYMKLPDELQYYLTIGETFFKGKRIISPTCYNKQRIGWKLFWENHCIHYTEEEVIVIINAQNELERDHILERLMHEKPTLPETYFFDAQGKTVNEEATITILGDTYLGEWYSKRRKVWDPLKDDDYYYSFRKVASICENSTVTILNLEAALPKDLDASPLKRKKKFVLGGQREKTCNVLKKLGVDLVTLATNHTFDYGQTGIRETLEGLSVSGISYIGSGYTEKEAQLPYKVETPKQTIYLFNGYWYRRNQYLNFDAYSIGQRLGVNCLSNDMLHMIRKVKEFDHNAKVIVIAHWGVDFQEITGYQQFLAEQLTDAGADLIIGHGPHCIQNIGTKHSKDIIYSIGNFIFNSNGEFDSHPNALPFGAIAQIKLTDDSAFLDLLFIKAENSKTKFQPYEVSIDEFEKIISVWGERYLKEYGWLIDRENLQITKKIW